MKRSRVALVLCPSILVIIAIAASCSVEADKKALKTATGRYYQPKDGGRDGSSNLGPTSNLEAGLMDAGDFEFPREIKNASQALQVLITAHDLEIKEGEFGKTNGSTPTMKAFCADLVEDVKVARARVKALAARKKVTPSRSNMTDRMRFESQASMSHLKNIFKNMFNDTYVSRRIDTANNLLRLMDEELAPILTDDDYKQELSTTRTELEKRIARAEAVKSGLMDGPTSSEGMFEEPDDPVSPLAHEPVSASPPQTSDGGTTGP